MPTLPIELRRLLAHGLLGVLLLVSQQQATLHWLAHAIEASQGKAAPSSDGSHCDTCDAVAAFASAISASVVALPAGHADFARHALAPPAEHAASTRLAYRSRAPPVLG